MLKRFAWHWLVIAFGLYLLTLIEPLGIRADRPSDLVWASLVLLLANKFIRPVIVFFTLPLVVLTLGLFLLVINALMLKLIPHLVAGFHVPGFTAALVGALLLSLINAIFGRWEKRSPARREAVRAVPSDVIDI